MKLDWPGLMLAGLSPRGLGGLGLTPDQFWALTPAELALMSGRQGAMRPLGRDRLAGLMEAWP
ncbi:MAG: hypothetical protein RLZZ528_1774, partial [Pseudomonadota bacterium]